MVSPGSFPGGYPGKRVPGRASPGNVPGSGILPWPKKGKEKKKLSFSEILAISLSPLSLDALPQQKFGSFVWPECGKDTREMRGTYRVAWARPGDSGWEPALRAV